jgi:hypothetical protein
MNFGTSVAAGDVAQRIEHDVIGRCNTYVRD